MNFNELTLIKQMVAAPRTVRVSDVHGQDRTLLFGYTTQRDSFHVYKQGGELHILIYDHNSDHPHRVKEHKRA